MKTIGPKGRIERPVTPAPPSARKATPPAEADPKAVGFAKQLGGRAPTEVERGNHALKAAALGLDGLAGMLEKDAPIEKLAARARSIDAAALATPIDHIDLHHRPEVRARLTRFVAAAEAFVAAHPELPIADTLNELRAAALASSTPTVLRSAFSRDPAQLASILIAEGRKAAEFVQDLAYSVTFFGGARVKPGTPDFERGKTWGEAVLLTNAASISPELVAKAEAAGVFSPTAIEAARQVALGVGVGRFGAVEVGAALSSFGGASGPEAWAAALSSLSAQAKSPEARFLELLTRTGAGPGMMEAVPMGYLEAKEKLQAAIAELAPEALAWMKTQGSRIQLPFEQETSPYIQQIATFEHFDPRREALEEAAGAFVNFPGGFGTVNEAMEVFRLDRPNVYDDPKFWGPFIETLHAQWKKRELVEPEALARLVVVDGPAEGLPALLAQMKSLPMPERPTEAITAQKAADVERGLAALAKMDPAVSFLGGARLSANDTEVAEAESLAKKLAKAGIPARAGGAGALLDAVSAGVKAGDPDMAVQALLLDKGQLDHAQVATKADVFETVHFERVHKILMYENTDAIVALPGGRGTFDEVWEVACLMQTGKLPQRPLVLVGAEFWQPILDAAKNAMLGGANKMIADDHPGPNGTKLSDVEKYFQVVDTAEQAFAIIAAHRGAEKSGS